MAQLELIKEHFHRLFDCKDKGEGEVIMAEIYEWSFQIGANYTWHWIHKMRKKSTFWNYFKYKVTTGISEGIDRAIKGLKWQAYGYKDMQYFKLKILQKVGYLNSRYHLMTV